MKKVAFFLPDLGGGGAERVILFLCRKFIEKGLQVDLILARCQGELLELVPAGVQLRCLSDKKFGFLDSLFFPLQTTIKLSAYLRTEKPDALLSTITGANIVAVLAKLLTRSTTRLVLREAATINNVRSKLRLISMRLLYPHADGVVALTEHMRSQLMEILKLPTAMVSCIPNPIDVDNIRLRAQEPLTHPWVDNDIPLILAIGRLSEQKDFSTLIDAFSLLVKTQPAKLAILGEGPLHGVLQHKINSLHLSNYILLAGFDSNPYRWLNRAALFVLSSQWEGQPNALLEALALSKSIVCTSYDSSIEEFCHQPNFSIVPPGNAASMAAAISTRLLTPREQLHQLPDPQLPTKQYIDLLCNMPNTI